MVINKGISSGLLKAPFFFQGSVSEFGVDHIDEYLTSFVVFNSPRQYFFPFFFFYVGVLFSFNFNLYISNDKSNISQMSYTNLLIFVTVKKKLKSTAIPLSIKKPRLSVQKKNKNKKQRAHVSNDLRFNIEEIQTVILSQKIVINRFNIVTSFGTDHYVDWDDTPGNSSLFPYYPNVNRFLAVRINPSSSIVTHPGH